MKTFEEEYDDFLKDAENDNKRLKLIIDDLDTSKYSYSGMKLSDITPIYSNNRIKIYIPEKRGNPGSKLF